MRVFLFDVFRTNSKKFNYSVIDNFFFFFHVSLHYLMSIIVPLYLRYFLEMDYFTAFRVMTLILSCILCIRILWFLVTFLDTAESSRGADFDYRWFSPKPYHEQIIHYCIIMLMYSILMIGPIFTIITTFFYILPLTGKDE